MSHLVEQLTVWRPGVFSEDSFHGSCNPLWSHCSSDHFPQNNSVTKLRARLLKRTSFAEEDEAGEGDEEAEPASQVPALYFKDGVPRQKVGNKIICCKSTDVGDHFHRCSETCDRDPRFAKVPSGPDRMEARQDAQQAELYDADTKPVQTGRRILRNIIAAKTNSIGSRDFQKMSAQELEDLMYGTHPKPERDMGYVDFMGVAHLPGYTPYEGTQKPKPPMGWWPTKEYRPSFTDVGTAEIGGGKFIRNGREVFL